MLKFLSTFRGMPVVEQQTGQLLGKVADWVIEPTKGVVVAFRLTNRLYVATVDVRNVLEDAIVTGDAGAAQELPELVRIKRLVDEPIKLLGLKVVSKDHAKIGSVKDVLLEIPTFYFSRLHVRPSMMQRLLTEERIFPREHILEITPRQVTVRYDKDIPAAGIEPEVV